MQINIKCTANRLCIKKNALNIAWLFLNKKKTQTFKTRINIYAE